jgi:hypothetical protein
MAAKDHGAAGLLAETSDRFIRPAGYHSAKNPYAVLTEGELNGLVHYVAGTPLFTLEEPDASFSKNRSAQSKRGQKTKDNRGGRPIKGRVRFRERWIDEVVRLHEQGWGLRPIAAEISRLARESRSHVTIGKWLEWRDKGR